MTPALQCRAITVGYDTVDVLDGLDLCVAAQEVVAVLGPSGSGKSTLLSTVAGFIDPRAGEVLLDGEVVADGRRSVPPEARNVAVVFQSGALWPHLTAADNVAYPMRRRGTGVATARSRAADLLATLGLDGLAERRPAELSGGQQQRVGLARALARGAGLYLFDEPTAHVDGPLRAALLAQMAERRAETGAAALYATHDAEEALAIADRVALLRDGRIVQLAAPAEIYGRPMDLWAARLTGPASLLAARGQVEGPGMVSVRIGDDQITVAGGAAPGCRNGAGVALVRADWARLGGPLPGVVEQTWYRGPHTDYRLASDAGTLDLREPGGPTAHAGERVGWELRQVWLVPDTQLGSGP
jgi:ABC-type Fe3+/spermidine/putrescine transport system ATPase subunit